jgi:HEAT repeat protein
MSHLTALARRAIGALAFVALLAAPAAAQKKKKPGADALMMAEVNVAATRSALTGADVDAATRAATALGRERSPAGLEALLDALALGLHPQVAGAAIDALALRPSPKSLDTLAHYLDHRNPKVRASAVTALAAIDDKRADKYILATLRDGHESVRAAGAAAIGKRHLKAGVAPLMKLMVKGDEAMALALASMADADLAKEVAELVGTAPDAIIARCLGAMLARADFKPESARVEVVRALGRVPSQDALEQLSNYVSSIPENPPRQSRKEAESIIEKRLEGK